MTGTPSSPKPSLGKIIGSPLAWVLICASLVRLVYFLEVRSDPSFTVPIWDAAIFDDMARNLAAGLGSGFHKAYFFGPLYPYFLGAVYTVTGASTSAAIILQHVLGVLLCGLTYRLGVHWCNRGTGILAGGFMAFSGLQIFFEGTLLMEVLVSVLLAGSFLLLCRGNNNPSRGTLAAAGLLLGLAATGRPTLLLLGPLTAFLVYGHRRAAKRFALTAAAIYLAAFAAPPAATLARNFAVEGVLVPVTSSGGYNFYLGNAGNEGGLFFDNRKIAFDTSWNGENTAEADVGRQLDSAEVSRYWLGKAWTDIRSHPMGWAGRILNKVQLYLNGQDVPQIESYTHARRRSWVLNLTLPSLHLLMALAVAGIVTLLPRRREVPHLYLITGVLVLGTAAFFVTTRYRVAALPYLCLFAGAFIMTVGRSILQREYKKILLFLGIALGAALFTLPARFPLNERTRDYSNHLHDGFKYAKAEHYPSALSAYAKAREVWPEDYESYLGAGIVHRSMGQLALSLEELETAFTLNTNDAEVPYNLGITLYKMNLIPASEKALRESLELDPRRALTHAYLGMSLAAQGRFDESRRAFQTSLELDPFEPFTHSNFGTLLAMQGEWNAARDQLLRALELDPGFLPARKNLAFVYLDSGDLAAAENEMRRVLELAPDDLQVQETLKSIAK